MRFASSRTALASVAMFSAGQALADTVPCVPMKRGTGEPCLRQLQSTANSAGYCAVVENVCDQMFVVKIPAASERNYFVNAMPNKVSKECLDRTGGVPTSTMVLDESACKAWDSKNKPAQMFKTPKPDVEKKQKAKDGFEEIIPEENPKPKPGFKVIENKEHTPSPHTPGAQRVASAQHCLAMSYGGGRHTLGNRCDKTISVFYCFAGPTRRDANCAERDDWVSMEIDPHGNTWVGAYESVGGRTYDKGTIWAGACLTPGDKSKWAGMISTQSKTACGFTDPEGGDSKFFARYNKKLSEDRARGEIDNAAIADLRRARERQARRRDQQEQDNENAAKAIELFGSVLGTIAKNKLETRPALAPDTSMRIGTRGRAR